MALWARSTLEHGWLVSRDPDSGQPLWAIRSRRHVERSRTEAALRQFARAQRDVIFDRDGFACLTCGSAEDLTVDHIIPIAQGGDSHLDNLQTLCRPCNSSKGAR